jgi:predicted DCC family thiol-disulfide oxidoreductase YuxK
MERLYVLYDAQCGLCSWAKRWLMRQTTLIDLRFVPAGSATARMLFPSLNQPGGQPDELVVISDQGAVYRESSAWIMCLFALEAYRDWANRLAHPLLRPLARQAFAAVSRQRSRISRWLWLASDVELAQTLSQVIAPACTTELASSASGNPRPAAQSSPPSQAQNNAAFTCDEPSRPPRAPH